MLMPIGLFNYSTMYICQIPSGTQYRSGPPTFHTSPSHYNMPQVRKWSCKRPFHSVHPSMEEVTEKQHPDEG